MIKSQTTRQWDFSESVVLFVREFHASDVNCWLTSLSKIPSHPIIIKSFSGLILKVYISGTAMITPGMPPKLAHFASKSPKVRETDNLPGKTLTGPSYFCRNYEFLI